MFLYRVKTRSGQFLVDSLSLEENSIGELKAAIWSLTKVHPDQCRIKIGFPPEEIFLVDDSQRIGEIFKSARETMLLEEEGTGGGGGGGTGKKRTSFFKTNQNKILNSISISICVAPAAAAPPPPQPKPKRTMHRVEVPANNSCMFVSVNYCLTRRLRPKCPELRELIANTVKADPETYSEAFLGKPNSEYCTWIRNEDHWGGGIELSILSKYHQLEIVAVDTQNTRLNRFGEDQAYDRRIFLIFDGIHYDPLIVRDSADPNNQEQAIFLADDAEATELAIAFAREAKAKHQYTDVNRMVLRCGQCGHTFPQTEARAHAKATGHADFSEVVG